MVVPIKLSLGSKTHASNKPQKSESPEAKSATDEAKASKEALQKSEKPDSFIPSKGTNGSRFQEKFDESPMPATPQKPSNEAAKVKRSSWFKARSERNADDNASISSNSMMESRRSGSWFSRSSRSKDSDTESNYSGSSSGKDSDASSITSTKSNSSWSSWRRDPDNNTVSSFGSERSFRSILGFRCKSSESFTPKPYQSPQRGEFTAKEHNYMTKYLKSKEEDLTAKGLNDAAGRAVISKNSHQTEKIYAPDYQFNSTTKPDLPKPVVTRQAEPEAPVGSAQYHQDLTKKYNREYEELFQKGDYAGAQKAYDMKSHHQTEALFAPDAKFNTSTATSSGSAKAASDKNTVNRQEESETTTQTTSPYGKSEWSSSKATLVEPEPKSIATGTKEERPVVNDLNGYALHVPQNKEWNPSAHLSGNTNKDVSEWPPKSSTNSDSKSLNDEPVTVTNGLQGYSPSKTTPDYHQELEAFDSQSRRHSWSSDTRTLNEQPIGKSDFKDPSTTKGHPHNDSNTYQKSIDTPSTNWSSKDEAEYDAITEKKLWNPNSVTTAEEKRFTELQSRAPLSNPMEVF